MPVDGTKPGVEKTVELNISEMEYVGRVGEPTTENTQLVEVDPFADTALVEICETNTTSEKAVSDGKALEKQVSLLAKPPSVFALALDNVHIYSLEMQALLFIDRYPDFNLLPDKHYNSSSETPLRQDFIFRLIENYQQIPKTLIPEPGGFKLDVHWKENFERALTMTQTEFGYDVREGRSIALVDMTHGFEAPLDGMDNLTFEGEFYREKFEKLSPRQRVEFLELTADSITSSDMLIDESKLEAKFKETVERWMTEKRPVTTEVAEKIMKLGIPVEEIPRYVDIAVYEYAKMPSEMVDFVKNYSTGYEPPNPFAEEITYDPASYFDAKAEEVKRLATENAGENATERAAEKARAKKLAIDLKKSIMDVLDVYPLRQSGAGSVNKAELDAKFEMGVEDWLDKKLNSVPEERLGGESRYEARMRIMEAVKLSGVGLEKAVGLINESIKYMALGKEGNYMTVDNLVDNFKRVAAGRAKAIEAYKMKVGVELSERAPISLSESTKVYTKVEVEAKAGVEGKARQAAFDKGRFLGDAAEMVQDPSVKDCLPDEKGGKKSGKKGSAGEKLRDTGITKVETVKGKLAGKEGKKAMGVKTR